MINNFPDLLIYDDANVLAEKAAEKIVAKIVAAQKLRGIATVVITGGTVGIATLGAIRSVPDFSKVVWSKVNVLWGDERFVDADSSERNFVQAQQVLFNFVDLDISRVYEFPSLDSGMSVVDAARFFEEKIVYSGIMNNVIDLLLLGVGPDGHVASLFPGHSNVLEVDSIVVPVVDSPKPPLNRLSFTFPFLNLAEDVFLLISGLNKADAVKKIFSYSSPLSIPASGVKGKKSTSCILDLDAASLL